MNESELRKHRCCFTGHRPEKLTISEKRMATLLESEIKQAIDSDHTTFITGMAKGVDLVAAEIVLCLRDRDPRLKLICALPHPGFGQHWGGGWTERFQRVLAQADLQRTICPAFSYASYQARNKWMVRHSDMVIAVFNGEKGGTKIRWISPKGTASHASSLTDNHRGASGICRRPLCCVSPANKSQALKWKNFKGGEKGYNKQSLQK